MSPSFRDGSNNVASRQAGRRFDWGWRPALAQGRDTSRRGPEAWSTRNDCTQIPARFFRQPQSGFPRPDVSGCPPRGRGTPDVPGLHPSFRYEATTGTELADTDASRAKYG